MKMFFSAFPVFVICFIIGRANCESLMEAESSNNTIFSPCVGTDCSFGCCLLPNAVCCDTGHLCCPPGSICLSVLGICITTVKESDQITLSSEKATSLISSVLQCPPGMSECAPGKCCPYVQGICCDDGEYCCPEGYWCDVYNIMCHSTYNATIPEKPMMKTREKSLYKSCPSGHGMCPSYMSCCVNDNGEWSCCPNTSLPEIQYGRGQCCDTIFQTNVCCPNDYPVCSIFGCSK